MFFFSDGFSAIDFIGVGNNIRYWSSIAKTCKGAINVEVLEYMPHLEGYWEISFEYYLVHSAPLPHVYMCIRSKSEAKVGSILTLSHNYLFHYIKLGDLIEFPKEIIGNNIYILLVSETKLNDTFPICQFLIESYQVPIRVDRNNHGGGLLLYFPDHISCKKVTINFDTAIEAIAIEINLKKRKWLLIG